eukprot:1161489-Pelagomonas_calceolata.AAC.6
MMVRIARQVKGHTFSNTRTSEPMMVSQAMPYNFNSNWPLHGIASAVLCALQPKLACAVQTRCAGAVLCAWQPMLVGAVQMALLRIWVLRCVHGSQCLWVLCKWRYLEYGCCGVCMAASACGCCANGAAWNLVAMLCGLQPIPVGDVQTALCGIKLLCCVSCSPYPWVLCNDASWNLREVLCGLQPIPVGAVQMALLMELGCCAAHTCGCCTNGTPPLAIQSITSAHT